LLRYGIEAFSAAEFCAAPEHDALRQDQSQRRAVIPAKAGIHLTGSENRRKERWMPAFAGMTIARQVIQPQIIMH
jgi:hypothetical protein